MRSAAALASVPGSVSPLPTAIWQQLSGNIYPGTAGKPKDIVRPLPEVKPEVGLPLYHSAPEGAVSLAIAAEGTAVIMQSFNPEADLQFVEPGPS
jgi:hypothetical protein